MNVTATTYHHSAMCDIHYGRPCSCTHNVTTFNSITASAVPSIPKTITATQRLAALNLAREIQEYGDTAVNPYARKLLRDSYSLLIELAGDAKGER